MKTEYWVNGFEENRKREITAMKTNNAFSFVVRHIEGGTRDKRILNLSLFCIFLKG